MSFVKELESLINRFSQENGSDTPDFILAGFLQDTLAAWNRAVVERERWYGRTKKEVPAPVGLSSPSALPSPPNHPAGTPDSPIPRLEWTPHPTTGWWWVRGLEQRSSHLCQVEIRDGLLTVIWFHGTTRTLESLNGYEFYPAHPPA